MISDLKNWFFGEINKINKYLAKLTKGERRPPLTKLETKIKENHRKPLKHKRLLEVILKVPTVLID